MRDVYPRTERQMHTHMFRDLTVLQTTCSTCYWRLLSVCECLVYEILAEGALFCPWILQGTNVTRCWKQFTGMLVHADVIQWYNTALSEFFSSTLIPANIQFHFISKILFWGRDLGNEQSSLSNAPPGYILIKTWLWRDLLGQQQ